MFILNATFYFLIGHALGIGIVDLYEGLVEVLGVLAHGDSLAKPCNQTASCHSEGSLSEFVRASRATGNETPRPKVTSQRPRKFFGVTWKHIQKNK